jgi:hypothetical protein
VAPFSYTWQVKRKEGVNMNNQSYQKPLERENDYAIAVLHIASIIIMLLGIVVMIFSLVGNIIVPILNTHVQGALFGIPVVYLGFRYFSAVRELKKERCKKEVIL